MRKYVFYDTDIEGNAEYDIRGEEYKMLIRICCQYGAVLYLLHLEPNLQIYKHLKKFEIQKPMNISEDTTAYLPYCEKRYYKVCPELCNVLLSAADGIFEWINGWGIKNPENPTFYRSDGTVFFASQIHNGVCAIMPREDENIEKILRAVTWNTGLNIRTWPPI